MNPKQLLVSLRDRLDAGWQRWLVRRVPARREVTLDQKNLFILPSRAGLFYLLLVLSLLIGGINYENNLLFLTAFLLVSLLIIGILHTFGNLAGLTLRAGHSQAVFAGHDARFDLALRGGAKGFHDSVVLQWADSNYHRAAISAQNEKILPIHVPTSQRGWFYPGRLLVQSWYPLGLIRTWTRIDLGTRCLVYPKPLAAPALPESRGKNQQGDPLLADGGEDFTGFRRYQPGDPLRHVAWKAAAKGGPLLSKQYGAYADSQTWLDWDSLSGVTNGETRLSMLCYWVLHLDAERIEYGLRLPDVEIQPTSGAEHRDKVLRELALFRLPEGAVS